MRQIVDRMAKAMADRFQKIAGPAVGADMQYWREMARASLAAMRDPDESVTTALARGAGCIHDPAMGWNNAIDEALK